MGLASEPQLVWRHYRRLNESIEGDRNASDSLTVASVEETLAYNAAHAMLHTCSSLEEILWFLWETVGVPGRPEGRGGLDRFKPALASPHGLDIDLGGTDWWEPLREAFTVRDCLLHGNGRLALLTPKKRTTMDRIIERACDSLSVHHDRVKVGHGYVRQTLVAAARMVDALHEARARRLEGDEGGIAWLSTPISVPRDPSRAKRARPDEAT